MTRAPYHGGSAARAGRAARKGPSLTPVQARAAWKGLCAAVRAAAASPLADHAIALAGVLRGAPKGSFPLAAGDARRAWADALRDLAERWRDMANPRERTRFAPALSALAEAVELLVWDLGAEEAARSRAATGQRDDD